MSLLTLLLIFIAGLIFQGLFAGYETGFVSANLIRLKYLSESERSTRAQRLLRYIQRPDQMLATLLIGTNVAVVTCTLVVSHAVELVIPPNHMVGVSLVDDIVSTAVVAPVMLVFSEIIPKSVFRTHPTRLSLGLLPVVDLFYWLFAPLAAPVAWLSRILLRLFGEEHHHLSPYMSSLEDVRDLVDEGVDHGAIEPEEQEMIHSVIDLQATTAKEIMVPRIAIQALPSTATRAELVDLFAQTGRTRIPIYKDSIDSIVGIVNVYAVLLDEDPERADIARFVRPVMHVPDSIRVDDLFRELKRSKQHLAIVTDEYGGTDGLVTIEDIVEEIFGEIQDEYDNEESPIHKLGPHAYVVDARMPLAQVAEATGVALDDEDVETIGGWLMHTAGYIPSQGQVVEKGRFRMTVLNGAANRIERIRIDVIPESAVQEAKAKP